MGYNIYLDTETTGFIPGQIAELSMIIEDSQTKQLLGAQNYFFTVDTMDAGAEQVHGLSMNKLEVLSHGERFQNRCDELYGLLSTSTLIAHNEAFDEKFLSSEFWRCGKSFRPADRACTMEYFKDILKIPAKTSRYGKYKNPKLSEVTGYLGILDTRIDRYCRKLFGGDENTSFHDSRFDTTAMYVAVNVYREKLAGGNTWHVAFCNVD